MAKTENKPNGIIIIADNVLEARMIRAHDCPGCKLGRYCSKMDEGSLKATLSNGVSAERAVCL